MTTANGRGVVAFRTSGGALRYAVLTDALELSGAEIAPAMKAGPTLSSTGLGARVAFTDASDALLTAVFSAGSGFGVVGKLTSDPGGSTSLAAPTTAAFGASDGSVHAGTNEGVYFAAIGGATEAISGAGSKKDIAPVLVFDGTGRPVVFYVRNSDSQLYVSVRTAPGTWSAPTFVAQNAFTDRSPSVARLTGGDLVVSWHGKDNQGIYAARASNPVSGWGQGAIVVQETAPVASSPVVIAADGGAGEILFVRGGVATRARLEGGAATVGATFGTGLSEIAGAYLTP